MPSSEELHKRNGRVDDVKVNAATEEQIAAWKLEDDIDDDALGPIRVVPPITDLPALRAAEAFARATGLRS